MATVLIVEDEFAISELLEMMLTDEGHRVTIASNGKQGLEQLASGPPPDLIITDFMMPILDGVGLLSSIQANETLRDIPYIIMSSMPEANVRRQLDGYAAFVRKPFQLAKIAELVSNLTGD